MYELPENTMFPTPILGELKDFEGTVVSTCRFESTGITQRLWMATIITQGLIAGYSSNLKVNEGYIPQCDQKNIVTEAFEFADELIKQENN